MTSAELVLQMVAFLQTEPGAPQPIEQWYFVPAARRWPGGPHFTTNEAAAHLAAMDKPLIIGALNEPGVVAVWPPGYLAPADHDYVARLLDNQVSALVDGLAETRASDADLVLFEGVTSLARVTVTELRTMLGQYGLTWGWRLGRPTDDSHALRLLVRKNPGQWSPGDSCGYG